MKGLQIGKIIKTILLKINRNVYPIVADLGTTFPYIVYRRSGLIPSSTKDRFNYSLLATVEVIVTANNYNDSINLAVEVAAELENTRGKILEFNIGGITLISADEDYIEDAFIQKLTFNIELL